MGDQEIALLRRWRERQDPEAFDELVARYAGMVFGVCRRILRNEPDAEDVTQECFLALAQTTRPPRESVGGWLHVLATRRCLSFLKSEKRRRSRERRAVTTDRPHANPAWDEIKEALDEAIAALPPELRHVLVSHYFERRAHHDIAQNLGVSRSTVSYRLEKAVKRVRARLKHQGVATGLGATVLAALLAEHLREVCVPPTLNVALGKIAISGGTSAPARPPAPSVALVQTAAKYYALGLFAFAVVGVFVLDNFFSEELPPRPTSRTAERVATNLHQPVRPQPVAPQTPSEDGEEPEREVVSGYSLAGTVRDAQTGMVLPGVRIKGDGIDTLTHADGRYFVGSLEPDRYHLNVSIHGYVTAKALSHITELGESRLDFLLHPAVDVAVKVRDTSGAPIEGVTVLRGALGERLHRASLSVTQTDAEGLAIVEEISRLDPQDLRVTKDGFRTISEGELHLDDETDVAEMTFVLEMLETLECVIVGRATDADGNPIPGVTVQWKHPSKTTYGGGHREDRIRSVTDADGNYRLVFWHTENLAHLGVSAAGWAPVVRQGVRGGTTQEPAVANFVLERGHWLEGWVVDSEGVAIAGARIDAMPLLEVLHSGDHCYPGVHRGAVCDGNGYFWLQGVSAPTALSVRGPKGSDWKELRKERVAVDRQIQLKLSRPTYGVIRGRVRDAETDVPVKAFAVRVCASGNRLEATDPGLSFSASDGRFLLTDLPQAKTHDLYVRANGYVEAWIRKVDAGQEDLPDEQVFTISKGRTLEGVIVDASSGKALVGEKIEFGITSYESVTWGEWALDLMHNHQQAVSDEDGRFQFLEAEPGTLFIRVPGYRRLVLRPRERSSYLDPSGELYLAMHPGESITGLYYDGAEPRGGATLGLQRIHEHRKYGDRPERTGYGQVETDPSGRFSYDDLDPGTYLLKSTKSEPGRGGLSYTICAQLRLVAGEHKEVRFGEDLGSAELRGRIVDAAGSPKDDLTIRLKPRFEWGVAELQAFASGSRGARFYLGDLRPGRYDLAVIDWSVSGGRTIHLPPVDVTNDEEEVVIALPKGD